jgi:2-iminoacetate synthase
MSDKPTFEQTITNFPWKLVMDKIYAKTSTQVETALANETRSLDDFMALISPAAAPYLEQMALLSKRATQRRFGKTIQMYIPLYLSNECQNICTYCGFSYNNNIPRRTLSDEEIIKEIEIIKGYGYDHLLLVTGEANKKVGVDYIKNALKLVKPYFSNISIEVQPLSQKAYEELSELGLNSVMVYQETYHRKMYKDYHTKGKKSNFNYRINTPDRIGKAQVHKIGLGVLLGLEDWRTDSFFTALHLQYLEKNYWKTRYSISFPRLRPAEGAIKPNTNITDRELVQLICSYRLFNQDLELSLSTRESEVFRNHLIGLGITSVSAGSKTNPGGYANGCSSLKQFEISDERLPSEFTEAVRQKGYEPVWKDWDSALQL